MEGFLSELDRGARGAAELRERLRISPPTLMRWVRDAGPEVIRLGRARATRYARRQVWPSLDAARFPLFRISESGDARPVGELMTLAARQSVWLPAGHLADGLPIELADARPSGFLGRHFAATHADLRLPLRTTDWSDHHILLAMSRRGEDLPGSLIVGDESFARWQALDGTAVRTDYPAIAEATTAGHPPGSSAGGERPKFGAFVDGRHVLVKFAARRAATDVVAQRWGDLLILEAIALDVVASHGIAAARTTIVETASHWCLESERFDRVGRRGRRGVLSLAAVHDDPVDTWSQAAHALLAAGRITTDDARRLRWLDAFGVLIGDTDRHQHNILFYADTAVSGPHGAGEGRPRLAPAFDLASMLYAPTADGQVPQRTFTVPAVTSATLEVWVDARAAAANFWQRGSEDQRISEDMRAIARENARLLA